MQNGTRLTIESPYERLSLALMTAENEKPKSHCVLKYAFEAQGEKRTWFSGSILPMYGFSDEQIKKTHRCPIEDCKKIGTLGSVLYHMACTHNMKITAIGKAVPYIASDARPLPTRMEQIKEITVGNMLFLIRGH